MGEPKTPPADPAEKKEPKTPPADPALAGDDLEELQAVQQRMLSELETINKKLTKAEPPEVNPEESIKAYFSEFIKKEE